MTPRQQRLIYHRRTALRNTGYPGDYVGQLGFSGIPVTVVAVLYVDSGYVTDGYVGA